MKRVITVVSLCVLMSGCAYIKSWFHDNPIPIPTPTPVVTGPADELDFAIVTVYSANKIVFDWSKTLTITNMERGNLFTWAYDKPCPWTERDGNIGNLWCFIEIEPGKWIAEACDWLRKGQNYRNPGDMKVCIGRLSDGTPNVIRPVSGQKYGLMTSTQCRNGKYGNGQERSQIKVGIWP